MWFGLSTNVCAAISTPKFLCRLFHVSQFQSPLHYNAEVLHQERELAMRRPSSWKKSNAYFPTAPRVSTAMCVKSYSGDRLLYNFDFFYLNFDRHLLHRLI